jgi:hypothetical protein
MKTRKFTVNLPSLVLGMALCLALVVLLGSSSPAPQVASSNTASAQAQARQRDMQKPVTLAMIMEKLEQMDQRIIIVANQVEFMRKGTWEAFARVEGQLSRIENK